MDAMNSVSITGGGYSAQISLVGGQLLNLTHHEDELIVPAAKTEGAFAGAVLAPWPNRTPGGSYTYAGVEHLLPVNEEATGAALHGLLTDLPLDVISQKDSEVRLQGWLESSEGYPFGLDIALTYRVSADVGLAATLMTRYRPEQLDEAVAPEAEPSQDQPTDDEPANEPLVDEPLPTVPGDGSPETSDDEAPAASSDADDSLSSEEPDSDGAVDAAAPDSAAPDGEAADSETTGDEEREGEVAADEEVEVETSDPNSNEDETTDATDAHVSAKAVSDPDGAETEVSDVEPTPLPVPQTAPFGAGFHPYLSAGGASLKECRLRLPAQTMLRTEADGTETARVPVSQDFDLTNGPLLAGRTIDHAFTDLPEEGWTAELVHGPSGFVVRMIADSPWVQVYTGEQIDRAGVAVEPMSCPPNALNSGEDLIHLVPGEWFRMGYSIEAIRAD